MRVEVSTDLTVGDLIEYKAKNILMVNHEYQRGLRWTGPQKMMFLDSIFREYSIPAFYFHERKVSAGRVSNTFYEIVDGQQRVDAIYTYSENAFQLIDPADTSGFRFPNFVKDKPCPWAGLRYNELSNDLQDKLKKTKIVTYKLITDDENEIRDLFIRLQGGTALTPQDKRDSWPGNFTEFVLRVGGKSPVPKWFGLPLYQELVKGNESRRRQLVAQAFMLFHAVRREKRFCDIKSANIDEFYHQNVGFDDSSTDAKRFERICGRIYDALSGKQKKVVGHHLIHSVMLYDSLMDEYARGWEGDFAGCLHEFERRCREASEASKKRRSSEFAHYWPSYAQWTQTQADLGRTIERRHVFFASEMLDLLSPTRLDDQRGFSDFDRQIIFFRDGQRCQRCAMQGDEHTVDWSDTEIHHVLPFSEGGHTVTENGALMHRECHPKGEREVDDFRAWWQRRKSGDAAKNSPIGLQGLPPEGTEVMFDYRDEMYTGVIGNGVIRLTGSHDGTYKTFSAASRAITGTNRNGWRDWSVRLPGEEDWVIADHWRTQVSISNLTLIAPIDGEGGYS